MGDPFFMVYNSDIGYTFVLYLSVQQWCFDRLHLEVFYILLVHIPP